MQSPPRRRARMRAAGLADRAIEKARADVVLARAGCTQVMIATSASNTASRPEGEAKHCTPKIGVGDGVKPSFVVADAVARASISDGVRRGTDAVEASVVGRAGQTIGEGNINTVEGSKPSIGAVPAENRADHEVKRMAMAGSRGLTGTLLG